jgi:threonine/homoserine/homoserine lactone efflux protein
MFIWSALVHLIALTSPGPDTAIVIRQTSIYGRKEGFKAALGIGVGIYAHCLLAINGISLIILSNDLYKFIISIVGGTYIAYLGISMYFSNSTNEIISTNTKYKNSFTIGFITNIFNIKAFLFFVSLFSVLLDSMYGIFYYLYPIYFSLISALWFIFLSYILTISKHKNFNIITNVYISSIMALVLFSIGLYIIFTSIYEYF